MSSAAWNSQIFKRADARSLVEIIVHGYTHARLNDQMLAWEIAGDPGPGAAKQSRVTLLVATLASRPAPQGDRALLGILQQVNTEAIHEGLGDQAGAHQRRLEQRLSGSDLVHRAGAGWQLCSDAVGVTDGAPGDQPDRRLHDGAVQELPDEGMSPQTSAPWAFLCCDGHSPGGRRIREVLEAEGLQILDWQAAQVSHPAGESTLAQIVQHALSSTQISVILVDPEPAGRWPMSLLAAGMSLLVQQDRTVLVHTDGPNPLRDLDGIACVRLGRTPGGRRRFSQAVAEALRAAETTAGSFHEQ